jgi:hypothetical protein
VLDSREIPWEDILAQDQTPKQYLRLVRMGGPGTGVFLQAVRGGGTVVRYVSRITHAECIRQAKSFLSPAFKWIPASVASYSEVQADLCEVVGEECKKSCSAKGCICDPATSSCVDSTGSARGGPRGNQSNQGNTVVVVSHPEPIKV